MRFGTISNIIVNLCKMTMTPPDIIFIVLDTQRADRLGAYGYDKPISPNLDRFASQSILFEQAVAFYQKLVDRETFPASKQTLAEFVEEERKHQTLLEEFKKGNRTLVEYDYEWIPDIKRSDYIVDMKYEPGMDFAEILRLAMKREEKALRLYNALATKTDNADCIKLFKMLAQEEAKHKQTFETLYDDHMAQLGD